MEKTSPAMAQPAARLVPPEDVLRQLCSVAADYAESRRRGRDDAAATWRRLFDITAESRAGSVDRASLLEEMAALPECRAAGEYLAELGAQPAPLLGAGRSVSVDRRALSWLMEAVVHRAATGPSR